MERGAEIALGFTGIVIFLAIVFALLGMYAFAAKALGVLFIIFAVFLIVYFPGATEIQEPVIGKTGIVIGIILFLAGVWLVFF